MVLKVYVGAVVAVATIAAGVAAATVHSSLTPSIAVLALMALLLWLTEFMQLRQYHYRGHGVSLNLIEGVLAPVIYACGGLAAVLVTAIGLSAAELLRRTGAIKTIFNTAQWVLAAAIGSIVLHAFDTHSAAQRVLAGALPVAPVGVVHHPTLRMGVYLS